MLLNVGQLLMSCVAVLAMVLTCAGVGRPLFRGLQLPSTDRVERTVWSLSLGLLAVGAGVHLLGLLGWLYRPVVGMFTSMAAFWGLGEVAQEYFLWRDRERYLSDREPDREQAAGARWAPVPWILAGAVAQAWYWMAMFLGALVPPTAIESTVERLGRCKSLLESHGLAIYGAPWSERLGLHDALLTWAMALDGPVAAQLVQVGMAMLVCLATVMLARPVLGCSWSWFAALALVPSFVLIQAVTLLRPELILALWLLLCTHAWREAAQTVELPGWSLAAGLCGGAALATGEVGLLAILAPAAVWGRKWRSTWRGSVRRGRLIRQFCTACLLLPLFISTPALFRSASSRLPDPMPSTPSTSNASAVCTTSAATRAAIGRAVPLRPSGLEPQSGHALHLAPSPWLLMAVPGLICVRRLRGLNSLIALAALVAILACCWLPCEQVLLLVTPLLAIPAAWVAMESRRLPHGGRSLVGAAWFATLAVALAVPWCGLRSCWQVALGWESRESYLRRTEPVYRASCIANCMSAQGDHLLSQDPRGLYFEAKVTPAGHTGWNADGPAPIVAAGGLSRYLRQRGLTHLLLVDPPGFGSDYRATPLSRLADDCLRSHPDSLLCLADYPVLDAQGGAWRYRLFWVR